MIILFSTGKCLRSWFKNSSCNLCAEACPLNAITINRIPRIDGSKCLSCGSCAAACPTGALEVGASRLILNAEGRGTIRVSCREKGPGILTLCINSLKLDHYYILADRFEEVIIDARCDGCVLRDPQAIERAKKAEASLTGRVKVLRGKGPRSPLVRRKAIGAALLKAVSLAADVGVSHVVIEDSERPLPADASLRRQALNAASNLGVSFKRGIPVPDPGICEYCGICSALCPAGAIRAPGDGVLILDLDSCLSCGLCAEACPVGALRIEYSSKRGLVTYTIEVETCPACGYTYPSRLGRCPKCESVKSMVLEFYRVRRGG